ncbi:16S rRNA (guanine(527)-N(7))-methyltransferase RsmG, partial [bacterium]|nr:16S rRNA (guanine(527)-N(7))-methyltransferase RsmG [bacterium]
MDKEAYFEGFDAHLLKREIELEPEAQSRLRLFFFLMHDYNQKVNLTRLDSPEDVVDYHLLDVFALSKALTINDGQSLIDVGSGAGIPGVLLKCLYPQLRLTILDSVGKKMDFVQNAYDQMDLFESKSISDRAEDLGHDLQHREQYDYASARALGAQSYCLELCAPFVKQGGIIALLRSDDDLVVEQDYYVETLGCSRENTAFYQLPQRNKPFRIEIYRKIHLTDGKYPRKPGKIKKRP